MGYYSDAFKLQLTPPKENIGTELGKMFVNLGTLAEANYQNRLKQQQAQEALDLRNAFTQANIEHLKQSDEMDRKKMETQSALNELKMLETGNLMADRGALSELPNYDTFEEFSKKFSLNNPESITIAKTYYDDRKKVADGTTMSAIRASLYEATGGIGPTLEQQRAFNTSEVGRRLWEQYPAAMLAVNDELNAMRREKAKKEPTDPLKNTLYKTLNQLPVDARGKGAAIVNDPTMSLEEKLSKLGELGVKAELSVDKRKATQKLAEQVGELEGMSPLLTRIVDNYQPNFVGPVDQFTHAVAEKTGIKPDKKMSVFNQDVAALKLLMKRLDNMGANFTVSEQTMLDAKMPNPKNADELFPARYLNWLATLRDTVRGKVQAVKGTKYDTGKLEAFIDELDNVIEYGKQKWADELPKDTSYADVTAASSEPQNAWESARGLAGDAGSAAAQLSTSVDPNDIVRTATNPKTGEKLYLSRKDGVWRPLK
ncbi:hypothetical protein [Hydrogenimonas sp.]